MQAVIFDLDGTLLNTIDTITYYGNQALSKYGFSTASADEYKHFVGNGAVKLIERALSKSGAWTKADFDRVFTYYNKLYDEKPLYLTRVYPGITELLSGLKQCGVKIGLLSNKPDTAVQGVVKHFFEGQIDLAFGGRPSVPLKPDPTAVNEILTLLGAEKSGSVFCGDSDVDILTANAAGLTSVGVSWGFRGFDELKNAGADVIVDRPNEILQILRVNE